MFTAMRKNPLGRLPVPFYAPRTAVMAKKTSGPQGELVFNVQDYGAKGDGSQDDGPAIQACIDALAAAQKSSNNTGTVFLPQGQRAYVSNSPIFMDQPNQQMVGGGAGCTIQSAGGCPCIYVGIKRDKPTDPSRFPDAYGVLDSTACPAKQQRYSQRVGGESTVQFQANGFQYGMATAGKYDYWNGTTALTVEFCVNFADDKIPAGIPLFGFGDWQRPSPWLVSTDGNLSTDWVFFFQTDTDRTARLFRFSVAGFKGPFRVAIQVDLAAGKASVLVNDKSVAVSYGDLGDSSPGAITKPWGPGLKFKPNDSSLFVVGGGKPDFDLCGLRLSNVVRYADPGVGHSLPIPPSDKTRYFTGDANTIAYLTMDSNDYMSQFVGFWNQSGYTGKAIRLSKTGVPWNSNIAVKNLTVQGNSICGTGITIGNLFNCDIDHVKAAALIPIASHPIACTYPLTLTNCTLNGNDCGFFGYFAIVNAVNTTITSAGARDAIRCVSCDSDWDAVLVAAPTTDTVFKFLGNGYGQSTRMKNVSIDFEGYTVNKAIVYAENNCYVPGTTLSLTDFWIGTVGTDAACIMLNDMSDGKDGSFRKAWLTAENIATWGPYRTFVETNGPLWGGVVNAYFLGPDNLLNHVPTYGPHSNVTFTNVTPHE